MTELAGTPDDRLVRLERLFVEALDTLEAASPIGKALHINHVAELALRLLKEPGGIDAMYRQATRFDAAGVFRGSDWATLRRLRPELVVHSLHQRGLMLAMECLSEIRILAIADGNLSHPDMDQDEARAFLETAIGFNLDLLYPDASEASRIMRAETPELMDGIRRLFETIIAHIGFSEILSRVIGAVERISMQRPILVRRLKSMLESVPHTGTHGLDPEVDAKVAVFINALHGPTELSRQASAPGAFGDLLPTLDIASVEEEARAFGDAMWATGIVSAQHATLLRFLNSNHRDLVGTALGLEETGLATLHVHSALVDELIETAVHPETAQCIYGLANLLVSGLTFFSPIPPSLRRLAKIPIAPYIGAVLDAELRRDAPYHDLSPNEILLAGALSVLGQPLGVAQGDNPTCQSARAISLWAQADPAYLLDLLTQAAHEDSIMMQFEGTPLYSGGLPPGMAAELHTELDPVSLVLVPHLDRIYAEMGRQAAPRGGDGHRWINPEFHGWFVHRGFALAVDVPTASITYEHFERFIRLFYTAYNPDYPGAYQLIHPQPVGIASTNHDGVFLGWHAVSVQRVFRHVDGQMRLYFFNPNNDGHQDWGQGIVTSTGGHGELLGESSLPFHQFVARLYLFHHNLHEGGELAAVPHKEIATIMDLARESWGAVYSWVGAPIAQA